MSRSVGVAFPSPPPSYDPANEAQFRLTVQRALQDVAALAPTAVDWTAGYATYDARYAAINHNHDDRYALIEHQHALNGSDLTGQLPVSKLAPGTNGYILKTVAGVPTWVEHTGGSTATSFGDLEGQILDSQVPASAVLQHLGDYATRSWADGRFVALDGSYSNPSWLTSLAADKISSGTFSGTYTFSGTVAYTGVTDVDEAAGVLVTDGLRTVERLVPTGTDTLVLTYDGDGNILFTDASFTHTHDASAIVSGTFGVNQIPNLPASKITSGNLAWARMPVGQNQTWDLGTLGSMNIVGGVSINGAAVSVAGHTHNASDVTSGTFAAERIPNLAATKIIAGSFNPGTYIFPGTLVVGTLHTSITGGVLAGSATGEVVAVTGSGTDPLVLVWDNGDILFTDASNTHVHDASAIVSGTFGVNQIPNLPASKITSGNLAWARMPVGQNQTWDLGTLGSMNIVGGVSINGAAVSVAGHGHAISDITSLQAELNGKANLSGATFTGQIKGQANFSWGYGGASYPAWLQHSATTNAERGGYGIWLVWNAHKSDNTTWVHDRTSLSSAYRVGVSHHDQGLAFYSGNDGLGDGTVDTWTRVFHVSPNGAGTFTGSVNAPLLFEDGVSLENKYPVKTAAATITGQWTFTSLVEMPSVKNATNMRFGPRLSFFTASSGYTHIGFWMAHDGTNFVNTHATIRGSALRITATGSLQWQVAQSKGAGPVSLTTRWEISPDGVLAAGAVPANNINAGTFKTGTFTFPGTLVAGAFRVSGFVGVSEGSGVVIVDGSNNFEKITGSGSDPLVLTYDGQGVVKFVNAAFTHTHDASAIVSGTFGVNQIPNLPASKITSGNLAWARMPVGQNQTWDLGTLGSMNIVGGVSINGAAVSVAGHTHPWSEVTGKPSTFPPSSHTHTIAQVSGLQAELDGKAPLVSPTFTGTVTMTGMLYLSAQQIYGGFGAETTAGVKDWNDVSNARSGNGFTLLYGSETGGDTALNGPGPARYFHPFSFEYSSKNGSGNLTQFAIPYGGHNHDITDTVWMRGRNGGVWNAWRAFAMQDWVSANFAAASHTHAASQITAGTFGAGNFTFQNGVRIGSGTLTSPGNVAIRSASAYISFHDVDTAGTRMGYLQISQSQAVWLNVNATPMRLINNGADRIRIEANGNVGIGYTSNQGYKLAVNGTGYYNGALTVAGGLTTTGDGTFTRIAGQAYLTKGGVDRARVAGVVVVTSVAGITPSDYPTGTIVLVK